MPEEPAPANAARSACVLIVEDEAIIALDLQYVLEEHGYNILGPARSVSMALGMLAGATPDVAVLDANLRGHSVAPVAERLRTMKVPFILSSADESCQLQDYAVLANVENVRKPFLKALLLDAVQRALASRRGSG